MFRCYCDTPKKHRFVRPVAGQHDRNNAERSFDIIALAINPGPYAKPKPTSENCGTALGIGVIAE
jgi:hypothetical protein